MGFFGRKKKPVSLEQISYDVAYFVLPPYVQNDLAKVIDMCRKDRESAGAFFYAMACQMRKVEMKREDALKFRWHHQRRESGLEYFVLEYPLPPPPADLSDLPPEQILARMQETVLAPYFSAVIPRDLSGKPQYYVLGQAPFGGTTLRSVDGAMNANLGPGPEPELQAFLDAVAQRISPHGNPDPNPGPG